MHENLKINCNSTDKPKLIKTDFSLAIIGGILLQFNQVNIQQYLDQRFKVISENEEMLCTFCVLVVCSAHLMRGVKYFVERSKWYHRNKQLKQLMLKVFGRLIVCHDFNIIKKIAYAAYHVFSTQYIDEFFQKQLRILEKTVNRHDVMH